MYSPANSEQTGICYRQPAKSDRLFLETELLDERTVHSLIVRLEVLQVLAAIRYEAQEAAARVLVFSILIKMSRKFFDSARQNSYLYLRRPRIGVVTAGFGDLVLLLSLR